MEEGIEGDERDGQVVEGTAGRWFEDLPVGLVVRHALTRTVTEADNLLFCALTHNPQPLHLDAEFAAGTEFGQRIVNSLFTHGLVVGVSVGDTTLGTTVANLGFEETVFPAPVLLGDTLRVETEVVAGLALLEVDRRAAGRADGGDAVGPVLVADLGTGSGAIGLSIAAERTGTRVWCTDVSLDALAVARANCAGLGQPAQRVTLAEGSWFEALPTELESSFDVVVAAGLPAQEAHCAHRFDLLGRCAHCA